MDPGAKEKSMEDESSSFEWDLAAEEEVTAIEASYAATKRRCPHLDNSNPGLASKCRRLPGWAAPPRPPPKGQEEDSSGVRDGTIDLCQYPRNELWSLAPHPREVDFKMRYPPMAFGGRIVYSRTSAEVEEATMELSDKIKAKKNNLDLVSLGFDIEWRPTFVRGEVPRKAAVMQICMDMTHCYVMHIIHSGVPSILKSLLEDASSIKVGICIANDAVKIRNDYGVSVEPLDDLSVLANLKLGGAPRKWGLCSLTEMLTCKQLPKPGRIRMGNWEIDVLSRDQLQYAATDAFASWYLYQVLKSFPDANSECETLEKSTGLQS